MKTKEIKTKQRKKRGPFWVKIFFLCLLCFFIGLYMARENLQTTPPPAPAKTENGLPKKIVAETEREDVAGKDKKKKTEELTFFNTLLAEPEPEPAVTASIAEKPSEKAPDQKKESFPESSKQKKEAPKNAKQASLSEKKKAGQRKTQSKTRDRVAKPKGTPFLKNPKKTGEENFKIQVASFALLSEAQQMKADLLARGYRSATIVSADLPGKGTWYRVYVGNFKTRLEAERSEEKFRSKEKLSTLIVRDRK